MDLPTRIVIVADDLSGAADCAVTCAVQGLRTVVQLSESAPEIGDAGHAVQVLGIDALAIDVLAIDAATRGMTADRAAATVERFVAAYGAASERVFFKKLDSLLRGHVGPELAAMRPLGTSAVIVMAPALPAQGRTTIEGCQRLNDRQIKNAEMPRMLQAAGLTSAVVGLKLVRSQASNLTAKMAELAERHDVLVCDAELEEDLRAVAAAGAAMPGAGWMGSIRWAGSAGLARHIPNAIGISGTASPEAKLTHFSGSILVVVGSRAPMAHAQVSEITRSGSITAIALAPDTLRNPASEKLREHTVALARELDSGKDAIVAIDSTANAGEDPNLCAALASWALPHLHKAGALVVTGGETARAVLAAAQIPALLLLLEVEPGVPLAIALGERNLPVITKSGSFGHTGTLARCVDVLRALKLE